MLLFALTSLSFQPVVTKLVIEQRANGSNENALKILKVLRNVLFIYVSSVSILFVYRGFLQVYNEMIALSVSNIIEQLLNVLFSLFFAF